MTRLAAWLCFNEASGIFVLLMLDTHNMQGEMDHLETNSPPVQPLLDCYEAGGRRRGVFGRGRG